MSCCRCRTFVLLFGLVTGRLAGQHVEPLPGEALALLRPQFSGQQVCNELKSALSDSMYCVCISPRMNIWWLRSSGSEYRLLEQLNRHPAVAAAQLNRNVQLRTTPNDPLFPQQWGLHNIGQTGGTAGADVRALSAWDITTGGLSPNGDTIVIAIVDDGFDLNHADLWFWKNKAEIPLNGLDDDSNGYLDDYDGWNSISNSGTIPAYNHGTEMTGVAAARSNNLLGVAGMNWNVQVLPVRGVGTEAQVVAAYTYVLESRIRYDATNGQQGAFIVVCNSSFGINNGKPENFPLWCAMYDTMGKYGILNVASTTNSKVNVDVVGDIPTTCPSNYLISVTNTNASDQLEAGYGPEHIDLGAPGSGILTTYAGNSYGNANGTSPSAAFVSGAIALLYSLNCYAFGQDMKSDPSATALQVRSWILGSVDTLAQLQDKVATGGRLNVFAALSQAISDYNCQVGLNQAEPSPVFIAPNPGTQQITVVLPDAVAGEISLYNLLGQPVRRWQPESRFPLYLDTGDLPAGPYLLMVETPRGSFSRIWIRQ
ncbi:MAG: S8 family serine peptidase [Chitinophagales bacterium]|nr:S8 family serine peptidase [Chitinophagales bacterium]MDW8393092.1 S8 family serine peptidase [Chitinophagales bacterium]